MFKLKVIVFLKGGNYMKLKANKVKCECDFEGSYNNLIFTEANVFLNIKIDEIQGHIVRYWWQGWGGY